MLSLDPKQNNIQKVFENFYEVPSYQREYVWKESNVKALLADIYHAFDAEAKNDYFIGTSVVAPNTQTSCLEVIDGQQRLTTLFILMIILDLKCPSDVLKNKIYNSKMTPAGTEETTYHLNLNYANAQQFLETIYNDPKKYEFIKTIGNRTNPLIKQLQEKYSKKLPDTIKNLYNAYKTINEFIVEHFENEDKLISFRGYVLCNVHILQISTDISQALQIFETINERGLSLNPLDLIKNRLFSHIDKKEFNKLKKQWQEIFKLFKKNGSHKLRFIRYFLMASFPDHISSLEKDKFKDGIIRTNNVFDFVSGLTDIKQPLNFLQYLKQAAEDYNGFLEGELEHESNTNLENINTLNGGLSTYIIALLAAKRLPQKLLEHFITQVESYMFFYIIPANNTNRLEKEFAAWAKELYHIAQITNKEQQRTAYNTFIQNFLILPTHGREGNFDDYFMRLEMDKNITKNKVRYILNKISAYVQEKWNGNNMTSNSFKGWHIEHILPQNPKEELRNTFGADIYEEYKNRIGNLTLLEQPLNKSAGNDFFKEKTPKYTASTCILTKSIVGLNIPLSQTSQTGKFFAEFPHWEDWNKNNIEERQKFLLTLTKEIWKIKIFS